MYPYYPFVPPQQQQQPMMDPLAVHRAIERDIRRRENKLKKKEEVDKKKEEGIWIPKRKPKTFTASDMLAFGFLFGPLIGFGYLQAFRYMMSAAGLR